MIFVTILSAWVLADFFGGIIHWVEDRILVGPSKNCFINLIQADNEYHHQYPAAIGQYSSWDNIRISVALVWPVALALYWGGVPTCIWLALFFVGFANAIHKYAHLPRAKIPRPVRALQAAGIFISFEQHNRHHFDRNGIIEKQNTTRDYCPMTCWLNPLLDRIRFFYLLEYLFIRK